jgi:hypothetical protein
MIPFFHVRMRVVHCDSNTWNGKIRGVLGFLSGSQHSLVCDQSPFTLFHHPSHSPVFIHTPPLTPFIVYSSCLRLFSRYSKLNFTVTFPSTLSPFSAVSPTTRLCSPLPSRDSTCWYCLPVIDVSFHGTDLLYFKTVDQCEYD